MDDAQSSIPGTQTKKKVGIVVAADGYESPQLSNDKLHPPPKIQPDCLCKCGTDAGGGSGRGE